MSKKVTKPNEEVMENTTPVVEEAKEEAKEITFVKGVVANCFALNVRKAPNKKSDVITILQKNTKVSVINPETKNGWYHIKLKNGSEGYCMKEFITINN